MTVPRLVPVLGLLLALTGCIPSNPPLHFYPVKGPAAVQQPVKVLTADVSGFLSGTLSLRLPSGEMLQGPWSVIPKDEVYNDLMPSWAFIYGDGFYLANVLGSTWHGKATLTGSEGTTFRLEFYKDTVRDASFMGVSVDNHGNTFKVTQ